MSTFEALPNELLARIVSYCDRKSLAQLRLTNRRVEDIAARKLFERVTLYAHWAKESDADSDDRRFYDRGGSVDGSNSEHDVHRNAYKQTIDGEDEDPDDFEPDADVRRNAVERSNRAIENDEADGFIAGSDMDEDELSDLVKDDDTDLTPRRGEGVDRSPRPDPFSRRLSDFRLYEQQRQDKWEAARPQWARDNFPGPPDYDATVFKNIIDSDKLKNLVKKVQVYTCETHCDHHPKTGSDFYGSSWPSPNFHPTYTACIERLHEFPNLCGLAVHFDRHEAGSDDDDVFQNDEFQRIWLERIVASAKDKIRDVAIRHYSNTEGTNQESKSETPRFLQTVAKASCLRLSVKHAEEHPGGGGTYRLENLHCSWEAFPSVFLKPASTTLTTLVLYSDLPLGWFPKLDLRNVHLPKLASLTLGHHIFHHDHQVDWILSHRDTLRELILDQCAILYQIGCTIPEWLDDDGYPQESWPGHTYQSYGVSFDFIDDPHDPDEFERMLLFKSHSLRWHAVFARFASSLPNLREFRFGTSAQWDFSTTTRHFRAGAVTHMPIMPWEDEHNIESRLFEERYVIWDDWENEYRSKWIQKGQRGRYRFGEGWREEWLARLEEYPECGQEDEDALQALLQTTRGR